MQAEKIVFKPMLVHLSLAEAICDSKNITDKKRQQAWDGVIIPSKYNHKALENNSYFKFFYSEHPKIEDFEGERIYRDFFEIINNRD